MVTFLWDDVLQEVAQIFHFQNYKNPKAKCEATWFSNLLLHPDLPSVSFSS